ncbi:MAG: hypothetical protein AAFR61_30290 [Bacteroidota bacterium]
MCKLRLLSILIFFGVLACQEVKDIPSGFESHFGPEEDLPVQGFFLDTSSADRAPGDSIPGKELFSVLTPLMREEIELYMDSLGLSCFAGKRLHLDSTLEAYQVYLKYNWYQQQLLLVKDLQQGQWVDHLTVALFYGGEGGQIAQESWLWKEAGQVKLLQWNSNHGLIPEGGEMVEYQDKASRFVCLEGRQFETCTQADSAGLAARFPMQWKW